MHSAARDSSTAEMQMLRSLINYAAALQPHRMATLLLFAEGSLLRVAVSAIHAQLQATLNELFGNRTSGNTTRHFFKKRLGLRCSELKRNFWAKPQMQRGLTV